MKVLVLGASGFLGGKVIERMKLEKDFEILGTCYKNNDDSNLVQLDVINDEQAKHIVNKFKPDVILWSLMSSQSEKDLIQIGLKNILSSIANNQKLIFISTNAVFRGNPQKGYFTEDEKPEYTNGTEDIDLYADAKIYGENMIKEHENHIIIRPGVIYGQDINGKWDGRILNLINSLERKEKVLRTKNIFNTFVKVEELTNAILQLIKINYKGIIHLGPANKECYYDYYVKIAKMLNLDHDLIVSNEISEPFDLSLDTSKSKQLLGNIFSDV